MTAHDELEGIPALQRCTNVVNLHFSLAVSEVSSPSVPPSLPPSPRHLATDGLGKTALPFVIVSSLTRAFQAFLEAVPSVVDLKLTFHFANLMENFSTVLQRNDVLPRLKTLPMMYSAMEEELFDPLLDAPRTRRERIEGRATLEVFYLDLTWSRPAALPRTVREELLAYINEGMGIID
ncbi:hypothetical protein MVEN_01944500 [Mycena venus]|uniref:Uncharacterized protein n=1 Tax=Mycena venus TaxID=2733690 RepID=A0A8H7CLE4_9AGAR|nr:hypothetical protein MVEN_01944500 [Mycena venus]